MSKLRESLPAKFLAACLCIVSAACALLGGIYCAEHWDGLFYGATYFSSYSYQDTLYKYRSEVEQALELCRNRDTLNYISRQELQRLEEVLDPENTNFRFNIRDSGSGEILWGNTGGVALEEMDTYGVVIFAGWDTVDTGTGEAGDGFPEPTVAVEEETGLTLLPGGAVLPDRVIVEYGVTNPLTADDAFREGELTYDPGDPFFLGLTGAALTVFLVLLFFLCWSAGHRKGTEGIHRTWHDRIPYDLYLLGMFWAVYGSIYLLAGCFQAWYRGWLSGTNVLGLGVFLGSAALLAALCLAVLVTTVVRIKSRTLLRNTVLWRLCALIGRSAVRAVRALPLTGRFVGGFVVYLLLNALLALLLLTSSATLLALTLLLLLNGWALTRACRWLAQWGAVRQGTAVILSGEPEAHIDTDGMFPDLRAHAEALNSLGTAVNRAVEERMRSERFKAELITNVSHDLKTPLTSIINYVDLMKKENIENETVRGYLEVLDRKSQRLKKLTEDLVEASKASTGTLPVNRERLGVSQLVDQAAAEYAERLNASRLELVPQLPEEELYVWADGRHLWRVLDNLLSNCCKYAMPGTRVYVDVRSEGENVTVTVKNVSRDKLNVPAEQLLARFVRGDESRSTEGSGLGLSIAQSLTELQGGTFTLTVDGDFFKAEVALPRAGAMGREAVL